MSKIDKVYNVIDKVLSTLLILFVCGGLAWAGYTVTHRQTETQATTYALTTVVVETDTATDVVTCEDSNGNLWEFYGVEDWQVGDCASLLMNDQGTPIIYDDTIEGARYSAWTLTH